jgi:hypothetical protein
MHRIAAKVGTGRATARRVHGPLAQLVQVGFLDPPLHRVVQDVALARDGLPQSRDGRPRCFARGFHLVEDLECHVELTDGSESLCNFANLSREPPHTLPCCEQRERFANAARSDTGLVKRVPIAPGSAGKVLFEGAKPLSNQEFRGC